MLAKPYNGKLLRRLKHFEEAIAISEALPEEGSGVRHEMEECNPKPDSTPDMSYSLNSLMGGYIGDYIWDDYRAY